ncbi:MAG: thioredoxin domain-containing protein [Gammaproteobacteria bacterium]|nr:thioredoxin domain-containing protein [Gammaproteobacteria bacterium]
MNRLADQASPYLRQHAHQAVAWQPWDEAALGQARAEDRPIFLSIGYSACHWCHVMAHEAFSDPETAARLNAEFVCIKVDREERPDLDRIYQLCHQILARRPGGWPLSVFLDPHSLRPFFAGTYFPREAGQGLPGLIELGDTLGRVWREQRAEIVAQNQALQQALDALAAPAAPGEPSPLALAALDMDWDAAVDREQGGLKGAPKFPQTPLLMQRLEREARPGAAADPALRLSLDALLRGGLFDQLGGGFFRYCVDETWSLPHFEKMLGENGLLLSLCCAAAGHYGEPRYAEAARLTGEWLLEAMALPVGGFAAALDADSEGREGHYYLWTREQLASLLDPQAYGLALAWYGLGQGPNVQEQPGHEGRWHLSARQDPAAVAEALGLHRKHLPLLLENTRQCLLAARRLRTAPGRDDKLLAGANGLALAGLARAAQRLHRPDFLEAALACADRLRRDLFVDGRLLAVFAGGRAYQAASLDDLAQLMHGLMELLQVQWRGADLDFLRALADSLIDHYTAPEGGFCYTPDDGETLIQRPRPHADDALPAGNALAARVLMRLGHLLAEPRYLQAGEAALRAGALALSMHPLSHASLALTLQDYLEPPELIVLRGPAGELPAWRSPAEAGYHPQRLVFCLANETALPAALAERYPPSAEVQALVCQGRSCQAPITGLADFGAWLGAGGGDSAWSLP